MPDVPIGEKIALMWEALTSLHPEVFEWYLLLLAAREANHE